MINQKNKQLLSRVVFLGVLGITVFGIFLMSRNLSKSQQTDLGGAIVEGFLSSEPDKAVLVEYSDFQCPACRIYYPLVKQLRTDLGDKLIFVYKHFPLKKHRNADAAARAAEAAGLQGKFDEMENVLFNGQDEWADSDQALLLFTAYAISFGLDKERFSADMDSEAIKNKVNGDYQEGIRLGINGTPTFFLNGRKITNPGNYDDFKLLVEKALKQ